MSNMASIFDIGHPRPSHAHTLRCSASRAHTGSYVDRIIGCYSKGFSCTQAMGEVGRLKIWRSSCGGTRHPQNGYRVAHRRPNMQPRDIKPSRMFQHGPRLRSKTVSRCAPTVIVGRPMVGLRPRPSGVCARPCRKGLHTVLAVSRLSFPTELPDGAPAARS